MRFINELPQNLMTRAVKSGVSLFQRDSGPSRFSIEPPLIPGHSRVYAINKEDGSLVGYLDYAWEERDSSMVSNAHIITQISVRIEAQGKGIGGLLLDSALHLFKLSQIQFALKDALSSVEEFTTTLEDVAEQLQPDFGSAKQPIRLFDFYTKRGYSITHAYSDGSREMQLKVPALIKEGHSNTLCSRQLKMGVARRHSFSSMDSEKFSEITSEPIVDVPAALELCDLIEKLPPLIVKFEEDDDLSLLKQELQQWLRENGLESSLENKMT